MIRTILAGLLALSFVIGVATSDVQAAAKNQMVKGTIKSADPETKVLVVNQKVGTEFVDRELSITADVEFVITSSKGTEEVTGVAGLELLEKAAGASVQVKCDKDVKVLKVTVKLKN